MEKIVKLSEIFCVSIDALVKGEQSASEQASAEQSVSEPPTPVIIERIVEKEKHEPRIIAGIILLCIGFVGSILLLFAAGTWGFFYMLPLFLVGGGCFVFKKNTGLYCAWTLFGVCDLFMTFATAINWRYVFQTFSWTADRNYGILLLSWVVFILMLALLLATVLRFAKQPIENIRKIMVFVLGSGVGFFVLRIVRKLVFRYFYARMEAGQVIIYHSQIVNAVAAVTNWLSFICVAVMLAQGIRLIYNKVKERRQ